MKKLFTTAIALALIVGCVALPLMAKDWPNPPVMRYRNIKGEFYDTWDLYTKTNTRPLKGEWLCLPKVDVFVSQCEVLQICHGGVVAQEVVDLNTFRPPFFLTNYPFVTNIADGDKISFSAMNTGRIQLTNIDGVVNTLILYDYGTAWKFTNQISSNPSQPRPEKSALSTNSP